MDTVELQAMTMEELRRDVQPIVETIYPPTMRQIVEDCGADLLRDHFADVERAAMLAVARARAEGEQRAFDALIGNWGWEHVAIGAHYLPILRSAIECDQGEEHEHQVIDIDTVLRLRTRAKAAAEALVAKLEAQR